MSKKSQKRKEKKFYLPEKAVAEVQLLQNKISVAQEEFAAYLRGIAHAYGIDGQINFNPADSSIREEKPDDPK